MRYGIYIYGRTLQIDFRDIVCPKGGLPSKADKLVRQLINTDVPSNGNIDRLRYLFVRDSDKILFGIGFDHSQFLTEELRTDYTGRRGLRSFVGIVMETNEFDKLSYFPVDFQFYINIYNENIKDVWNLDDRPQNRIVKESLLTNVEIASSWCKLDGSINFNPDNNKCRFFPLSSEKEILKSLKRCDSNVMVGLNVESHVTSAFRRFNVNISNALCLDTADFHDVIFSTERSRTKEKYEIPSRRQEKKQIKRRTYKTEDLEQNNAYNPSLRQPALLSSLKRVSSPDTVSSEIPDDNLMNIDWGEETYNKTDCTNISPQSQFEGTDGEHTNCEVEDKSNELSSPDDKPKSETPKKALGPKLIQLAVCLAIGVAILLILPKRCKSNTSGNFQSTSTSGDSIKKDMQMMPSNSFPTKTKKK